MTRRITSFAALCVAISSPVYADKLRMTIRPSSDAQVSRMEHGEQALDSHGRVADIRVRPSLDEIKKRGSFQLLVFNGSSRSFDIGTDNIHATTSTGEAVRIIGYEQLAKELRGKVRWAAVGAAFLAAGNNINASQQGYGSGVVNYRSNTYGTFGNTNFRANTTGTGYYSFQDPVAQQMALDRADRQNNAMFQNLQAASAAGRERLEQNLRTTTVDPGHSTGGIIVFELLESVTRSKTPVSVSFVIDTDNDQHVINAVFVGKKMTLPATQGPQPKPVVNADRLQTPTETVMPIVQPKPMGMTSDIFAAQPEPQVQTAESPIMNAYRQDIVKTGTKSKAVPMKIDN